MEASQGFLCSTVEVEKAQQELQLQDTTRRQDIESLKQQLVQMEQETQLSLKNQKKAHEEDLAQLKQEKVSAAASSLMRERGALLGCKLQLDIFAVEMRQTGNIEGNVPGAPYPGHSDHWVTWGDLTQAQQCLGKVPWGTFPRAR